MSFEDRSAFASMNITDDVNEYDWNDSYEDLATLNRSRVSQAQGTLAEHLPPPRHPLRVVNPDEPVIAQPTAMSTIHQAAQTQQQTPGANDQRTRNTSLVQESANDMLLRLSNEFVPVVEDNADTLIYLGTPPRTPGQDDHEYEYIKHLFERPYLFKGDTLKRLRSSKFERFLGPMSARTQRRLKKQRVHERVKHPDSLKYYVDLSPILSDDEALIQITELTVPQGALQWHKVAKDFGVPPPHVCGRDSLNVPPRPTFAFLFPTELTAEDQNTNNDQSPLSEPAATRPEVQPVEYETFLEEEYTPLRHHTAIARLLQAIAGNDPKLNSAAKAWTFCMLAKYFDCAQSSAVSHWVITWLLAENNAHFIQVNPAIAYRMAMATQSVWLIKCTFSILVGQQVMQDSAAAHQDTSPANLRGRHMTHVANLLDDDEIDRIDHAASALTHRIKRVFEEVAVFPGAWTFTSGAGSQTQKLRELQFQDPSCQIVLDQAKDLIKLYVRRIIYMTMSHAYKSDERKAIPLYKPFKNDTAYTDLPRPLRLFTQYFWQVLRKEEFATDYTDTVANRQIWQRTLDMLKYEGVIHEDISYVSRTNVFDAIDKLNQKIDSVSRYNMLERRTIGDEQPGTYEANNPTKKVKLMAPLHRVFNLFHTESDSDAVRKAIDISTTSGTSEHVFRSGEENNTSSADTDGDSIDYKEWQDTSIQPDVPVGISASRSPLEIPIRAKPGNALAQPAAFKVSSIPFGTAEKVREMSRDAANSWNLPVRSQAPVSLPPTSVMSDGPEQHNRIPDFSSSQPAAEFSVSTVYQTAVHDQSVSVGIEPSPNDRALTQVSTNNCPTSPKRSLPPEHSSWLDIPHDNRGHKPWTDYYAAPLTDSRSTNNWFPQGLTGETARYTTMDVNVGLERNHFTPANLLNEIGTQIYIRLESIITPGYVQDKSCELDIPTSEIGTLLCLSEEEYKYLPLWAEGCDDGTGGVFNDGGEIPDAPEVEMGGFRGGAMGIIPGVGSSIGGSIAGSEFEEITTEIGVSTVGKASRFATDGTATETVISLDE